MAEKIATREAYGKALAALADKYPDLVCFDADLAGATMTKFFKAACPERFFDMGIAEADMVGVAAGMSLCGFKPPAARSPLSTPSPCSPPAGPGSRSATPSPTRT